MARSKKDDGHRAELSSLEMDDRDRLEYLQAKAASTVVRGDDRLVAVLEKARSLVADLASNDPARWRCLQRCHELSRRERMALCRPCRAYEHAKTLVAEIEAVLAL